MPKLVPVPTWALLCLLPGLACQASQPDPESAGSGAGAGAMASAAAGGVAAGTGGMAGADAACEPSGAPNTWASWRVPDPESVSGDTAQHYTLTDEIATDAVTGLTWQRYVAAEPHDWQAASRYCSCLTLGGHDDWTLPSRLELVSIVDYTRQNPSLDALAFPETPFEWFWSASRTAESAERYWYVAFWDGNTHAANADQQYWTRCVRQTTGTTPHYDSPLAGTVRDNSTQLTWQLAASSERSTWSEASQACSMLDLQGTGWRLPTMKELQTLVDETRAAPAIDPEAFPDTPAEGFWAATPLAASGGAHWFVSFDAGIAYNALDTHPYRYRCVR